MGRTDQFVAAAALPALLPTPPRSKMAPLLPTPCLIILPNSFASPSSKPKPGRADSVERWDAHKTGAGDATPPPTTERRAAGRGRGLCRADACDRWDSSKTSSTSLSRSSASSSSSSSPRSSRSGSSSSRRSPARSSSSRASSGERWDINKKGSNAAVTMGQMTDKKISKPRYAEFAGPSFVSPEPCMLPMPKFLMAH